VQITPGYADAWRELGIALGKLNQPDEGEAALREAINLNRPILTPSRLSAAF